MCAEGGMHKGKMFDEEGLWWVQEAGEGLGVQAGHGVDDAHDPIP